MKNGHFSIAAGLLSAVSLGDIAAAQVTEEVTVKASRITQEKVGRSLYGVPIMEINLSYHVNYRDLDLRTSAGAAALEALVTKAAQDACKEIDARYPAAEPGNAECAKVATKQSMIKVREAVAAAGKGTTR
jgi:UrcA family protein